MISPPSLGHYCFCAFWWQDDLQMMFSSSTYGGSLSQNLEDFDSIRSVLLYRSVALLNGLNLNCLHCCLALSPGGLCKYRRGFKNLVQVCVELELTNVKSSENMCACKSKVKKIWCPCLKKKKKKWNCTFKLHDSYFYVWNPSMHFVWPALHRVDKSTSNIWN